MRSLVDKADAVVLSYFFSSAKSPTVEKPLIATTVSQLVTRFKQLESSVLAAISRLHRVP